MRVPLALLIAVAAFAPVCTAREPAMGAAAPPLQLARTFPGGVRANWAALRGKPVVVEFWATWCGNCVEEIGHLNQLATQFPGIQFLSISDEDAATVEPFLAKHPMSGWVALDRGGATFKAYGVEERPKSFLVDATGVLRGAFHPAQVSAAMLTDLQAGRSVRATGLVDRLRMMQDNSVDPVYAVMLRPSAIPKAGGRFNITNGKLQGENVPLKSIIAYAYSVPASRLVADEATMAKRYDFCVLLPEGVTGEVAVLRDMLERSLRLKIRRQPSERDAATLRLVGPTPPEVREGRPMQTLAQLLEARLNRHVVDETGLTARYAAFSLPEDAAQLAATLREKLGIQLTMERRPVELLHIESLEEPGYRVAFH